MGRGGFRGQSNRDWQPSTARLASVPVPITSAELSKAVRGDHARRHGHVSETPRVSCRALKSSPRGGPSDAAS
jgi:hypothetical protein